MAKGGFFEKYSLAIAILILAGAIFYVGTNKTWDSGEFDWDYILNFTIVPPTGYPPGYTPPPGNGDGGSGSMTAAECSQYATLNGKTNSILKGSEGDCASYANSYCGSQGMEGWYDYVGNCCLFNCQPITPTSCQTFCSSHGLQIIQTGEWTEQQCYDSAIYVCGGLLYLETDLVSPDGTCCCYLCK